MIETEGASFWRQALAPVAPKEEPEVDPAEVSMADWAEYRQGRIKNMSNVRGIEADNPVARAREIAQMFQPKPTKFESEYAAERAQNGIRNVSEIFQAQAPNPRSHKSPYQL